MKNLKKYIVIIVLGLFTIMLIVVNFIDSGKLQANHVYVLGVITYSEFSARGTINKYDYYYLKNKYSKTSTSVGWDKKKGDFFFLKIYPNDPDIAKIVMNVKAPPCLTMESVPEMGWKELPIDSCK